MLELDADYGFHKTASNGGPPLPHTLFVIFHGRLGALTSQKFHCSSVEHAEDVLEQLGRIDPGHIEHEILIGHL